MTDSGTAIAQGDNFTSAGGAFNYYIFGTRAGYADGPEDVRNRYTFSGNYTLPVGKGQRWLNGNGISTKALGGLQTSLTEQIQDGEPFTVGTANFTGVNNLSQNAIRIRDPFVGGGTPDPSLNFPAGAVCPAKVHTLSAWFNPCAFKNPAPGVGCHRPDHYRCGGYTVPWRPRQSDPRDRVQPHQHVRVQVISDLPRGATAAALRYFQCFQYTCLHHYRRKRWSQRSSHRSRQLSLLPKTTRPTHASFSSLSSLPTEPFLAAPLLQGRREFLRERFLLDRYARGTRSLP